MTDEKFIQRLLAEVGKASDQLQELINVKEQTTVVNLDALKREFLAIKDPALKLEATQRKQPDMTNGIIQTIQDGTAPHFALWKAVTAVADAAVLLNTEKHKDLYELANGLNQLLLSLQAHLSDAKFPR